MWNRYRSTHYGSYILIGAIILTVVACASTRSHVHASATRLPAAATGMANVPYHNCGNAQYQEPTPTALSLSPGDTLPAINGISGPVSKQQVLSTIHEVLLHQTGITTKGPITCNAQLLPQNSLSSLIPTGVTTTPTVWVIVVQGQFVVSVGSSNTMQDTYEVFLASSEQPLTVYSNSLYTTSLPTVVAGI